MTRTVLTYPQRGGARREVRLEPRRLPGGLDRGGGGALFVARVEAIGAQENPTPPVLELVLEDEEHVS